MAVITNTSVNPAELITVGSIGRNENVGNVTSATLNTVKASVIGNTQTINSISPEGVFNDINEFDASNNIADVANETKDINGSTGGPGLSFIYLTYGDWFECTGCNTTNENGVTGGFVYGLATDPAAIPTTGTFTYVGGIQGLAVDSAGQTSSTFADFSSTADFSTRTISFATTNTAIFNSLSGVVNSPNMNMNGNLSYTSGSNQFSGTVTSTGMSGVATGKFFGPAAQEIGGVYTLRGSGAGHDGVFAGK